MATKEEKASRELTAVEREEAARVARLEVETVESEQEPLVPHVYEFPLLDGDAGEYQHAPETAGLDYAGELVDDEATPRSRAKSSAGKTAADDK